MQTVLLYLVFATQVKLAMNIAYILKYTFRSIYLWYFLLNLLYSCLLFSVSLKCSSFSFESYTSLLLLQKVSKIEVAPSKWTRPRVGRLPRLCRERRRPGIVGGGRWPSHELPSVVPRHSGTLVAHSQWRVQVPVPELGGTGRGRLCPGWTSQWTRPPLLHFSGFVVSGMNFRCFSKILYMPNLNLLTLLRCLRKK